MLDTIWKVLAPMLFGNLFNPSGKKSLLDNMGDLGNLANNAYRQLLSSYSPESYESFYNSSYVSPVKRTLQEEIIPQIKNQFLSGNQLGSSALNKALSDSIQQAALRLGEGLMSGYTSSNRDALQALGQLLQLSQRSPSDSSQPTLGGLFGSLAKSSEKGAYRLGERLGDKAVNWVTQKLFN